MHCKNCGKEIDENTDVCPTCSNEENQDRFPFRKLKMVAVFLAIFLGALGFHNFYLGYYIRGLIQLILTIFIFGPIISVIWSVIEMVLILLGNMKDAKGNPLQ